MSGEREEAGKAGGAQRDLGHRMDRKEQGARLRPGGAEAAVERDGQGKATGQRRRTGRIFAVNLN